MLVNLKTLLEDARINHYAVAGFTTPTIDTCEAVLQAAEDMNAPVVIGQAQLYEEFGPIEKFGPVMAHMAEQAKVPVCLHLDHGTSIDYIMKAMKAGYTSVMADFSHLDFEENARIVKMCCRLPRYLTKPRQRRSKWDMAGSDGISRVSAVFRGELLLTNKMRII